MNNKIAFGIVGVVVGIAITLVLGSTGRGWTMMGGGNYLNNISTSGGTSGMMGNIDRHFIEQMIPHHDGAIAMANLALEKATHPEIKTLAQDIVKAQTEENQQMKSWYQNWFGAQVPVTSQGMMMGGGSLVHMTGMSGGDLETLQNAKNFDQEFIRQMIPHHEMAIMMARMLEVGTNRPEMKQLAENIINSQSEEIIKMRGWYQAWYGQN